MKVKTGFKIFFYLTEWTWFCYVWYFSCKKKLKKKKWLGLNWTQTKTIHNAFSARRWLQGPASINCLAVTTWANNSPANLTGSLAKSKHNTCNRNRSGARSSVYPEKTRITRKRRSSTRHFKGLLVMRPEDEATTS